MMIRAKVEYFDELDARDSTDYIVVSGKTAGKCIDRIYNFYGKDAIIKISFYELEDVLLDDDLTDLVSRKDWN